MLDHLGLPVSNLAASKAFYRQALAPLGYELLMEFPGDSGEIEVAGFGIAPKPDFWIVQNSTPIAPSHVAFRAADRSFVRLFYSAATAAGGTDNGEPALCPEYHPTYYGAFVFDPDGHNIEAVCHLAE